MLVQYSYLVESAYGSQIEDEVHSSELFPSEEWAVGKLMKNGFEAVDKNNYKKKITDTLFYIATFIR